MMENDNQIQIIPAGEEDFSDLHALAASSMGPEWTWLNSLGMLTLPNILRFKAVIADSSQLVGFIASEFPNSESVAWILALGVDAEYRRHGIAQRLLAVCEVTSQAIRYRLCVRRSNENAQRLYQQVGYQQVGVWANYYLNEDAFVFEKKSAGIEK
jgi:ribosomal protein S18 acetylase RimI-like enzyme